MTNELSNRIDDGGAPPSIPTGVVDTLNPTLHKYNVYNNYYKTQPSSKISTVYNKTPLTLSSSSLYHQPPSSDKLSYYFNGNKNNNYYSNKSPSNQLNLNGGNTVNNKNNIFSTLGTSYNGYGGGGVAGSSSSPLKNKWNQNNLLGVLGR